MSVHALPTWLVATRDSLGAELGTLPEEESLLFAEATEALRDAPYRVYSLGSESAAAALLTGLVSLRLQVMHENLNPLVTSERAAASARRLCDWLFEHERAARAALPRGDRSATLAALRYDTLAALNPLPRKGARTLSPADVSALVRRWESFRAGESFATYLRKKLAQNADFFRHGFNLPAYWIRRRRIRRALTPALRDNPVVMETYFAIEQVGPIIDGFVFRAAGRSLSRGAAISDFAFLYMQMADELVDNLVHHLGPSGVRDLVDEFYPRSLRGALMIPFENLTDEALSAAGLSPDTAIPKYETTFSGLMTLLHDLREILLTQTREAEAEGASRVVSEVQDFFHHCFGTYLDELFLPDSLAPGQTLDQLPVEDVQWHFFRKNNLVMMRFMALRARLTGLEPAAHAEVLQRWGYLLATFQIFDDMKDVWVDLRFQPNYALQTAASMFPEEYEWLRSNHGLATRLGHESGTVTRDEVLWLNANVPRTILHCIRLSKLMALSCFDYLALYAWDHRWRKNWMSRYRAFNPEGRPDALARTAIQDARSRFDTGAPVIDTLFALLHQMAPTGDALRADDEHLAYVLDCVAYEHPGAVYRAALPSPRRFYRYATLRMMLPAAEKVQLLRRLLRRHQGAVRAALKTLRALPADTSRDALAPAPRALVDRLSQVLEGRPERSWPEGDGDARHQGSESDDNEESAISRL